MTNPNALAVGDVLISVTICPTLLILLIIPSLCYFICIGFSFIRKCMFAEIRIWLFIILIVGVNYFVVFSNQEKELVPLRYISHVEEDIQGQDQGPLLALNNNYNLYSKRALATKYLNWNISLKVWEDLDSPQTILEILDQFKKDPPEVVIDSDENHFMKLRQKSPEIRERYQLMGDYFFLKEE